MNISLIYPHPMTMLEYIEWSKSSPDFDLAIGEVIRCELSHVNDRRGRILLANLRCYEIAAVMQGVLFDYFQDSESYGKFIEILENGEVPCKHCGI